MYSSVQQRYISHFFFYLLLMIAPFIYYIKYTAYGFFHAEVAMIFGLLFVTSIGLTLLEACWGWFGRIFISSIIITIAFSFLPGFKTDIMMLVVYIIALLLVLFLDDHIRTIFIFMTLAFVGSLFLLPMQHQGTKYAEHHFLVKKPLNNSLPPVIHLMLDEHAGIEGIPTDIAEGKTLRTNLESFYNSNGFHLYGAAYSHYMQTFNSVSNLVNFASSPINHHYFFNHSSKLKQNTYFKLMAEKGYRIRVYQFNSMIDYCQTDKYPIESCYDYPAANLNSIQGLGLSTNNRFLFMLKSYLLWSQAYVMLMLDYQTYIYQPFTAMGFKVPSWSWYQAKTSALYIPEIFQQIAHDVKQHPHGTFFYAHILGPHNPFVYDANCQLIKNPMNWQISIGLDPIPNTPETRSERYTLYENQVRCVTKQVQLLIDDLKQAGIYQQTIIIVNGDHGARITEHLPLETAKDQFTLQSYKDCFNALFAVKMPGLSPVTSFKPITIQKILANVVGKITGVTIPVEVAAPYAYLLPETYNATMSRIYLSTIKH